MRDLVLEYKSISDNVADLADYVANAIINDTKNQQKTASDQTYQFFKENTFQIRVRNFLKGGDILTVNYIMYFFKSEDFYSGYVQSHGQKFNSEADEETNTIKIVSAFIGDEIADDLYEIIYHELEHLYQYGMGMKKRKTLYAKTRELLDRGKKDINGYYVGLCCYFSFKHEQDAFVHQFYAQLFQNTKNDDFENLINIYQPYKTMLKAYNVLVKNRNNDSIMNAINYLGYSRSSFIKLVNYRWKRFKRKLLNAYSRFIEETSHLNEHNIDLQIQRMNNILNESDNNGYDIIWGIESIYKFDYRNKNNG